MPARYKYSLPVPVPVGLLVAERNAVRRTRYPDKQYHISYSNSLCHKHLVRKYLIMALLSKGSCGLLYILLSAILFSVMGAFLKKTTGEFGIPSTELVFFRAIFQGFFVVLGLLHFREDCDGENQLEEMHQMKGTARNDDDDININASHSRDGQNEPESVMIHDDLHMHNMEDDVEDQDSIRLRLRLIHIPFGKSEYEKKIVILRGIIGGGFGFICYFFSIKSLPLGDAITLFSLYPIYTIIMARFYLNESITCRHLITAVVSVLGGTLIAGPSFLFNQENPDNVQDDQYNPLGYVTALIGGIFAAAVVILIRKAGTIGVHTLQLLFSWSCFGLLASILFGMTFGRLVEGMWIPPASREAWVLILITCALGTVAHGLLNYAGRFVPAGQCAIVRSTDILWAYLLEIFMFDEVPTFTTTVGVILITSSMIMIAMEKVKEERDQRAYKLLNKEAEQATKEFELI